MSRLGVILSITGVVGLVLIIGGFFARDIIKDRINSYRADRLIQQAEVAFEVENWTEAARKGTAAFYLDPSDRDNNLLVARALMKQRNHSAIEWWKRILEHPDVPVDELREMTTALFYLNRVDEGLTFLNRLVELDGDSRETQHLWFNALRLQARYTTSMNLAESLIGKGSDEWQVHQHYISMREALSGDEGKSIAIEHLVELIEKENALAIPAARELATRSDAPLTFRLMAAGYLVEKSDDVIDRLYAVSVEIREEAVDLAKLEAILKEIEADLDNVNLVQLAHWAVWMDRSGWFVNLVDYETFVASENDPDLYLKAMIEAGMSRDLISLAERLGTAGGNNSAPFLYYRAVASQNLGDAKQAENTLVLAAEVVDPAESVTLERYLLRDKRSDLLLQLYENQLKEDPDDPQILQKLAYVHYMLGNQDDLEALVRRVDMEDFTNSPPALTFLLYLKLMVGTSLEETHKEISANLVRFPELFEFRMLMGVSHLLHGQPDLAAGFIERMPALNPDSPRFLRVCAVLLGRDRQEFLSLSDEESLMPRERLLLSRTFPANAP
jgi:tetratricopeptide (TPR) repeat protein